MYAWFEPDSQYEDPNDFGYGTFWDEQGQGTYGFDPELAGMLPMMPPDRQQPPEPPPELQSPELAAFARGGPGGSAVPVPQSEMAGAYPAVAPDVPVPLYERTLPPLPDKPPTREELQQRAREGQAAEPVPMPQTEPGPPAPPGPVDEHGLLPIRGLDKTTPAFRAKLADTAGKLGIDPNALAAIISFESGFDPAITSGGDSDAPGRDKHGGLIQFSKKHFGGVARAAGRPGVQWDDMVNMPPEEQLDFVEAYYRLAGVEPGMNVGDLYMRTFMPAHKDKADDFVLSDAASKKGFSVQTDKDRALDRNKDGIVNAYEQNAGLDRDKDGRVTVGDVKSTGPAELLAAAGGEMGPPLPPGMQLGPNGLERAESYAAAGGAPPGMVLGQVQRSSSRLNPEQQATQRALIAQGYAARTQGLDEATATRMQALNTMARQQNALAHRQSTEAQARQAWIDKSRLEVQDKIDRVLRQPMQKLDAGRYIRNLGHGGRILGAVAMALGAVGARLMGGPNISKNLIDQAVEADIADQRHEIEAGQASRNNLLAYYKEKLGSLEQAEAAVRAMSKQAVASHLRAQDWSMKGADAKARAEEQAGIFEAEANDQLAELERAQLEKEVATYVPPKLPEQSEHVLSIGERKLLTPEQKRAVVANWKRTRTPAQQASERAQLDKAVGSLTKFQEALNELEAAYGVQPDAEGNYPAYESPWFGEAAPGTADYSSHATGPDWTNYPDAFGDARDRRIQTAYSKIMEAARENWKTEPPNEIQKMFLGMSKPPRDTLVPAFLEDLRRRVERSEALLQEGHHQGAYFERELVRGIDTDKKAVDRIIDPSELQNQAGY